MILLRLRHFIFYPKLARYLSNEDHTLKTTYERLQNMAAKKRRLTELNVKDTITSQSTFDLQVISNGFHGSSKSCVLKGSDTSYLINCGEHIVRKITHDGVDGMNLKKIQDLFITRFNHVNMTGFMSFTLDLLDMNSTITVHSKADVFIDKTSLKCRSLFDTTSQISQHNYSKQPSFHDKHINVFPFSTDEITYSYLFQLKKPKPSVLKSKLDELNLSPGPWVNELIHGKEYKSSYGLVIKPEDVLDYSNAREKHILFLDLNDLSTLEKINAEKQINDTKIDLIVHLSRSELLNDPVYIEWCKNYKDKNCIHLYLDENVPSLSFKAVHDQQAILNMANEELFPLLDTQTDQFKKTLDEFYRKEKLLQQNVKIVFGRPNLEFKIKPVLQLNLKNIPDINNDQIRKQILNSYKNEKKENDQESSEAFKAMLAKAEQIEYKQVLNQTSYPKILFLGTTSAVSTAIRNYTSILVKTNETMSLLMDCGEGTYLQLSKFFGEENVNNELVKIKAVYISHNHIDHHYGLYSLVIRRYEAFQKLGLPYEKLELMFPRYYIETLIWLDEYFNNNIFDKVTLTSNELFYNFHKNFAANHKTDFIKKKTGQKYENLNPDERKEVIERINLKIGVRAIQLIPVKHIHYSTAIDLMIGRNLEVAPFRLVYSGDCRPSSSMSTFCKEPDLLIHECTYDDSLLEEAIKNNHSTFSEGNLNNSILKMQYLIQFNIVLMNGF